MTPDFAYEPPRTGEELLRRYAAGERYFPDADIPENSSLRKAVLAGAVFKEAWLSCVDFRDADLRGCRFEGCNVKCSDFSGADLRNATFTEGCPIEATIWDDAKVEGARFDVTFHGATFRDPEFPFGQEGGRTAQF